MEELKIITKPELGSNQKLEEEFTAEIFRRVKKRPSSATPQFLFFRPQSRPKEEFHENIAPLFEKELSSQETIFVSISNNTEKSDAYLDETEFKYKMKVKFILTERSLETDRNEEALLKIINMLIEAYRFRKVKDGEDDENEEQDTEKSKEIRSRLKDVREPVTLLILNDFMSEYTNSLLSALDDVEFPYQQREMQATQIHVYKWDNVLVIDLSSSQDIDLVEAYLDQVSKNGKLVIIVVQPEGSECDLKDQKMRIKSKSTRGEASWHIVVTMETANVPSGHEPQENQELERLSIKTKLPKDNIHFVKNYTDAKKDSCLNRLHLTVLKDIVDCVQTHSVRDKQRRIWWLSPRYIIPTVILVSAVVYALSTTDLKSVFKIPRLYSTNAFITFKDFLNMAWSFMSTVS